jgi:hypothetical protein
LLAGSPAPLTKTRRANGRSRHGGLGEKEGGVLEVVEDVERGAAAHGAQGQGAASCAGALPLSRSDSTTSPPGADRSAQCSVEPREGAGAPEDGRRERGDGARPRASDLRARSCTRRNMPRRRRRGASGPFGVRRADGGRARAWVVVRGSSRRMGQRCPPAGRGPEPMGSEKPANGEVAGACDDTKPAKRTRSGNDGEASRSHDGEPRRRDPRGHEGAGRGPAPAGPDGPPRRRGQEPVARGPRSPGGRRRRGTCGRLVRSSDFCDPRRVRCPRAGAEKSSIFKEQADPAPDRELNPGEPRRPWARRGGRVDVSYPWPQPAPIDTR